MPVVEHHGLFERFMVPTPDLDPFAYALEAIPTDDPEAASIVPDRETYYADPNKGTLVFTGDLTLRVGDHTFNVLHTPGHTPGQVAVHVPEERAVFTGDTIFCECQTWLMTSNVDGWLEALERIRELDVDHLIPGHGPVTTLDRDEGPLGAPARLEEPVREVGAGAQLGDRQLERPDPAVEEARSVAVALAEAFGGPLVRPRPELLGHVGLHELLDRPAQRLADDVRLGRAGSLFETDEQCHPLVGHRGGLLSERQTFTGRPRGDPRRQGPRLTPRLGTVLMSVSMGYS